MAQPDTIQKLETGSSAEESNLTEKEDVNPIDIVVTRAVVETIVKHYDPTLELVDFTAEAGSALGDNYMAIMYLVTIKVTKQRNSRSSGDETEPTTHSIMLKTMPLNVARQQMVNECRAFVKEALMYGTIFPAFTELETKLGIPYAELYSDYPLCFASFVDGKSDYLALENLRTTGYLMADRHKGLDRDHIHLAMKSLAKLHALSYVTYHGDFHAILKDYPDLKETMWTADGPMLEMTKMFIGTTMKNNIDELRSSGFEAEASELERPEFAVDVILQRMSDLISQPVPYAVIAHGDCWTNNMLFKYDSETGRPTDIKLIDFQLSRPCSRAIDLLYFLLAVPQDHLINCEEEFLRVYYDAFAAHAKKLGFLQKELTYEQLLEEYNHFRYFGIVTAFIILQFFYAQKENVKDMEQLAITELSEVDVEAFFSGMSNAIVIKKLRNVIRTQIPKLKL